MDVVLPEGGSYRALSEPADELNIDQLIKRHVLCVLRSCDGQIPQSAKKLGVTTKTIYNWLHQWGLFDEFKK